MFTTRLSRKKRMIQGFQAAEKYGIFDGIDRVFMETYRLDQEEFQFLTHALSDDETTSFFTNELQTFKEKGQALALLQNHMEKYMRNY